MHSLSKSKYRTKHKVRKIGKMKKAQFFILSVFIITGVMFLISKWMQPLNIIDTSSVVLHEEPFIFNNIIEKAEETIKTTKNCEDLPFNLEEYKNFVEGFVLEKGFLINFTYNINDCSSVELNVSLSSQKMKINVSRTITIQ
jgi:hypothetical protein